MKLLDVLKRSRPAIVAFVALGAGTAAVAETCDRECLLQQARQRRIIPGGWLCETETRGQVSRPLVATRGSASGRALDENVYLLWGKAGWMVVRDGNSHGALDENVYLRWGEAWWMVVRDGNSGTGQQTDGKICPRIERTEKRRTQGDNFSTVRR